MECNKDEAVRAVEIAVMKIQKKDFVGANKFALKAQNMFPSMEGIQLLLAALNVCVTATTTVNGERDWYAILGVDPSATEQEIKTSYRRTLLKVHPDKNKWDGADEALHLVNEAWKQLSNEDSRAAYDQKRLTSQDNKATNSTSPASQTEEGTSQSHPKTQAQKRTRQFNSKKASPKRQKLNKFSASQDAPTSSSVSKRPRASSFENKTTGTPAFAAAHAALRKATPGSLVRAREEAVEAFLQRMISFKNGTRAFTDLQNDIGAHDNPAKEVPVNGPSENERSVSFKTDEIAGSGSDKAKKLAKLSRQKVRIFLTQSAKANIWKRLTEWKKAADATSHLEKAHEVHSSGVKGRKRKDVSNTEMDVPDSDFHNFDSDRTASAFKKGQVWALYDDQHGMPRLYAKVERVLSEEPFEAQLRWLNSKHNAEFGPMRWIACGFHKTSGQFHRGNPLIKNDTSCFSHVVNCTYGKRGVTYVYPKKGDLWAVYRNWSSDWDASVRLSAEVFNQFDIVEVLQDYNEEKGVTVAPLDKVPGFRTVLQRNSDPASHMTIPKHEIFRLSHQVPFRLVTEDENRISSRGCYEFDPAAVPCEFVQAILEEKPANGVVELRGKS
uniref:J domain-containing protein n=1 Tax=Kalanchoe fedtschenkoi TaxID=63787 RepID=A0A7N0SZX2_KALFE